PAQDRDKKCTGAPPDSLALAAGPVYRDCEVDKKADLRSRNLVLNYLALPTTPPADDRCLRAEFQFVVDTLGRVELPTVALTSANSTALADMIRPIVDSLRYRPARLADRPVRQVVVFGSAVPALSEVMGSARVGRATSSTRPTGDMAPPGARAIPPGVRGPGC
ncbi:MAG: hypothetical protein HOP28_05745, partial [Gemmatimonadales bacterium]|nr:hypothetical protein [Gemmatimonadales bacterium]